MDWSDETYTGTETITGSLFYGGTSGTSFISGTHWYSITDFGVVLFITTKELLAIAAAEKDRLHWSFPLPTARLWSYSPVFILRVRRMMISISGWLARVGKKRKSGK